MRMRGWVRRAMTMGACVVALACGVTGASRAATGLTPGATAPGFTKTEIGGATVSLSDYAGKVVVLFLFSPGCPYCQQDAPSVEANIFQYYNSTKPGQVAVLGLDVTDYPPNSVLSFKNTYGITFPLLRQCSDVAGAYVQNEAVPFDNYVVINKQGIVRYHSALNWPHGSRYHTNEIKGTVDSLVTNMVDVGEPRATAELSLAIAPNPSPGRSTVRLAVPGSGATRVRVDVLDLAGRHVATLWNAPAPGGSLTLAWDATGTAGRAAPGVYLVRADVDGRRIERRVVLIR